MKITKKLVQKVIETVDAGLCSGVGYPEPGHMCVEAAVCYALGLPHGDEPICVSPAIRALKIRLNDSAWSSNMARASGMRKLAVLQLGTDTGFDDVAFAQQLALLAQKCAKRAACWGSPVARKAATTHSARDTRARRYPQRWALRLGATRRARTSTWWPLSAMRR